MTRTLYHFILWMHPPAFRKRFRDEMLSIYDEGEACASTFALLLDGLLSFARHWLLRTGSWKVPVALSGAFIQVWGLGYRINGHQSWTNNRQALTPYFQEVILMTLALICSLFIVIVWLTLWAMRLQRRRFTGTRVRE